MTFIPRCEVCEYARPGPPGHMECRRNPPQPRAETAQAVWPIVGEGAWCGEFEETWESLRTRPIPPAPPPPPPYRREERGFKFPFIPVGNRARK